MDGVDAASLATGLVGGLALFLFGLDILATSLKLLAGDYMKAILGRMTRNRFLGLFAGAAVTALLQSSSVTTVLLVGFITAGLMKTSQSVPMILGANIGSTVTAQILAFNVTAFALPVIAAGFFLSFVATRPDLREYGRLLLGLGLVFFGMTIMGGAVTPLRDYPPFLDFMQSLHNPLLAALVGAAFTAVIQSSAATTGILIVMAGQGLISLEPAIALALGANVGTCATALLAALGKPREAVRAAVIHTLFNVVGVLLWIGFTGALADLARSFAADVPRQLANVHTLFNVANALLFIGFTRQISRFAEWLVPSRPPRIEPRYAPRHLNPGLLDVPAVALDAARLEILHLGRILRDLLDAAFPALLSGSPVQIDALRVADRPVDLLHREIVGYLRQVSLRDLAPEHSQLLMAYMRIANDLEHIGDQVATGMVTSARKRIDENVVISEATVVMLMRLHREVQKTLAAAMDALETGDPQRAAEARAMKEGFVQLLDEIESHQMARLRADAPQRLAAYAREIELAEALNDIFKTIRRIALTQLAVAGKITPRPAA